MLDVSVTLSEIHCRDEADSAGNAEPYLWTIFFKIDGETIRQSADLTHLEGDAVFHFGPGSHENLHTHAVDAGDNVKIPPAIGEWNTTLFPITLKKRDGTKVTFPGMVGVATVLMEEDNVTDSGAEIGHQVLNSYVQTQINEFVHSLNLAFLASAEHPAEALNQLIEELKKRIKKESRDAVRNAISDAQGVLANLWSRLDSDDKIGAEVFNYNERDIVDGRYSIPISARWKNEGDWSIYGTITSPNPCLSVLGAVNQQKSEIQSRESRIRAIRAEMLHATAEHRAQLQQEISELEGEIAALQAELDRRESALQLCYRQNSWEGWGPSRDSDVGTGGAGVDRTTPNDARAELSVAVGKGKVRSQRETLNRGATVWFRGMAAPAERGTVALDTGFGPYVVIDEKDVLAVEKHDPAFLVEVNVGTNVLVRSESILRVGPECCAPLKEQEPKTPGTIASMFCLGAWVLRCTWHTGPNGLPYRICWPEWNDCAYLAGRDFIQPTRQRLSGKL